MVKRKVKVIIHMKDWRVVAIMAFMAGILSVTAPRMIVVVLLFGAIIGVIKLVELGRL